MGHSFGEFIIFLDSWRYFWIFKVLENLTFESAVQTQLVLYNQNIQNIDQPAWQVRRYLITLESRNLLLMIELSVQ